MWGGLRLFLALTVVICHARTYAFGGRHLLAPTLAPACIAVEMFFTISGFVITRAVGRHYSGRGGFVRFWQNRALRLLPPYWAALGAAVILARFGYPLFMPRAGGWSSALFIIGQTGFFGARPDANFPLIASWSLAVEVFYYFVLSAIAARNRRHARTFLLASCGVVAVAIIEVPVGAMYFGILWQAFPFAVGCWLAWSDLPKVGASASKMLVGLAAAYTWLTPQSVVSYYGAAVVACAAIVACESVPNTGTGRFVADLSYPVYIIQVPAMALVLRLHAWTFVIAAPFAALAAGIAINRLVEAPIRRVRARIREPARLLAEGQAAISLVE